MPIVSGGSGSGGAGAMTQLYALTLGADGTFDQASIAQTYNHLFMILIARSPRVATNDIAVIRFNNDSGANQYLWQSILGRVTTAAAGQDLTRTSGVLNGGVPAASVGAGIWSTSHIWIAGYASTTWHKACTSVEAGPEDEAANYEAGANCTIWKSTAAINRIQVFGNSTANLLSGSQLFIYGVT